MTIWSDLTYGLRQFRRAPEFSVPALLTLALGVGVAAAVFTVVQRVLLRPLPYPAPHQLVRIWDRHDGAGLPRFSVSAGNYFAWQQQSQTFAAVGGYREDAFTLATAAGAERVEGARITASLLQVLGVQPVMGRPIQPSDDQPGAAGVALVSHALASRLGGLTAVVGTTVMLDAQPHTIVGVLPAAFRFPQQERAEILVPYLLSSNAPDRQAHFLRVLGRLASNVEITRAHADLAVIASRLEADYPESNRGWTVAIDTLHQATVGSVRQPLMILLGASALLVIITSANVAGLLLARIASREGEFAVRAALGAGTLRIARQLVTESLLLSLAGGLMGLMLGRLALGLLLVVNGDALPRATEIVMDVTAVAVIMGVSVLTGLIFSLVPLLTRGLEGSHRQTLAGSGRAVRGRAQPIRRVLVAGQLALALSLAVGAALLVGNLVRLQQIDPGFSTSGVLTFDLRPPTGRYGEPAARTRLYREVLSRLDALPGAEAAGAAHRLPLAGNSGHQLLIEGRSPQAPDQAPNVNYRAVAGRYFEALGIGLMRGRFFTDTEMWESGGAIIVNRALATRYFGDEDPLLRRVIGPRREPLQIVGIVDDVRETSIDRPAEPALYFPYATYPVPAMALIIRSGNAIESIARPAHQAISEVDSLLAPGPMQTVDEFMRAVMAAPRFNTLLLGSFAAIALILAAVGVYGVTAYAVTQRTSEIGLRMALGAAERDIFRSVLAPGLRLAAIGALAGLACAAALARLLGGVILGVNADQPIPYIATALLLVAIATAATILPARRAMRLDPVAALRRE